MQGILVEQDTDNFIRFDFYKRNDIVTVYAGVFENLVSLGTYSKVTIADLDPPLYLACLTPGGYLGNALLLQWYRVELGLCL